MPKRSLFAHEDNLTARGRGLQAGGPLPDGEQLDVGALGLVCTLGVVGGGRCVRLEGDTVAADACPVSSPADDGELHEDNPIAMAATELAVAMPVIASRRRGRAWVNIRPLCAAHLTGV